MPRSSSGPEILLGLLTVEPMSGYDLRQAILGSIGHFWNESYGQIYPNLKRLAAGGYVKSRTVHQQGKPDRHLYSITEKGRQRLRKWLAVPPQPEIPRNELLLKLFLGAQTTPGILIGYVDDMARQSRAILETLGRALAEGVEANPRHPAAPYWRMAVRFGQLEIEAHRRWAEETLATLHRIAAQQTGRVKEKKHANR